MREPCPARVDGSSCGAALAVSTIVACSRRGGQTAGRRERQRDREAICDLNTTDSLFPSDWACQRRAESFAPRSAQCTKFGNLVGLVLSWRTVFALLVLRATCGCCTRAHQGSAVVMLSPSRLDLDPSGPRPAALSTVAHYEKTYRAPQRTNLLDSESNVGKL